MYFKKLELVGFKSFADRTTIEFESGVTAIVGPNGCGKSNISDAIRWVLGEQSAKSLRGSNMNDIIFNGSSTKEATGFAEVSLTLSNETKILPVDYDEVTITRRLYRSGESEYLINKNPVRLRDIHEMLMGTGIGTESYSIIEQGKMDVILNSKPDDRREIFEEAAGITKFKSQKKETLRKLESTDQNLLRVNDIIQEVKRQISSIERQAKKAEAYKVEFEKLRKIELAVARHEFVLFEDRRRSKESELEALNFKESQALIRSGEYENIYLEKKTGLDELDISLHESSAKEMSLGGEIRRDQDRILLNRERMGELVERRENLLRQLEGAKKRIQEFAAEYDALSGEYAQAEIDERESLSFLNSVEADFAAIENFVKSAESESLALRDQLESLADRKSVLQSDLANIRAEMSSLENRLRRLREEEAFQRLQVEKVSAEFSAASDEVLKSDSSLLVMRNQKESAQETLDFSRSRVHEIETFLDTALLNESTLRSKLVFLEDLRNRHEGFWGGVKALLEQKEAGADSVSGMIGLVADLVRVEKGYEFAAEAALGSYLQAVVFRTDEDVVRAAEYLRDQKKGRAILLSLEYATAFESVGPVEGVQSALSFISAKDEMAGLLEFLLSGVYLVDDVRRALQIGKQFAETICVTRSGERVENRVVAAGSNREDESFALVGRESRIGDCKNELQSLMSSIAVYQGELEVGRAVELEAESALKHLSEEILKIQFELGDRKSRLRHLEESRQRVSQAWQVVQEEIGGLGVEEKTYQGRSTELDHEHASVSAQERSQSERLIHIAESIREKTRLREDLLVRLAETRSRQSAFTARREKIEKDKNWVTQSRGAQEELALSYEKESAETLAKKEVLDTESVLLDEQLTRLAEERDGLLRHLEGLRLHREESAGELRAIDLDRQVVMKDLDETRRRLHEFEMENAQIGFEINRLKERIFNTYQVDLSVHAAMDETQSEAMAVFSGESGLEVGIEDLRLQIQSLREKLNKMGPVNLVAIEEHGELKTRFEFLVQQEQDLIKAKEDLHKAILKINRTTKELFLETFQKVKEHFSEYFKLLFSGGHAELVLLDEENILESGIEIIARPPGKKPQSITLLSGGEKALTAVALMFSLFRVKPSPFCILDEIDAPLDETNVERFCNVLKDFITGSQFILITHNKRTMNLADAMYGITMVQAGISRVVSVKFNARAVQSTEQAVQEVTADQN